MTRRGFGETALPSRSSLTSFVVVTAMLLAAICVTPMPITTPFASRLAELDARLEADIAMARIARLEHELAALQHQIDEKTSRHRFSRL